MGGRAFAVALAPRQLIGDEMPVPDHPLWKEWLVSENALEEAG